MYCVFFVCVRNIYFFFFLVRKYEFHEMSLSQYNVIWRIVELNSLKGERETLLSFSFLLARISSKFAIIRTLHKTTPRSTFLSRCVNIYRISHFNRSSSKTFSIFVCTTKCFQQKFVWFDKGWLFSEERFSRSSEGHLYFPHWTTIFFS